MTFFLYAGVLLLFAVQPLILLASDTPVGPLIARGDRNFPPYEFINDDGEPDGFNIDLLKAISSRLEMNVDIGLDAWETVRGDLEKGKIHMATGMIRSAERQKTFDFSVTHAGVFYCLFIRKGSPIRNIEDARGKEILVHAQAYSHDWLAEHNITDRIIPVSSPQEAFRLLASGRHDCAVIERLSGLDLVDVLKIDNIVLAGPPLVCGPYAFAVRKGDHRLLARLNEGIHLLHQNGMYEDLYRKWFSVADAHTRRMAVIRTALFVLAAIAGLAISVFIWNLTLKKTVRRRTTALLQSERRFQALCDLLPQTVFETDAKGNISFLNRSGFDMLGLGEKSVNHGICLSAFLSGVPDLYAVATTGIRRGEACVVNGPGIEPFPALLYLAPVRSNANGSGFRGLLVDISFQKELEKQIIESQKLEASGRMAGGVAHDFSNIITGISAYAQLIRIRPDDMKTVTDGADKILTGCDRATDLVRHFLATACRRTPERCQVQVGKVVSEVFKLLQPTYGANITFNNTIDSSAETVWAEPALVFQIFMNLCVNSAQAMTEKGGLLTVGVIDEKMVDTAEKEDQANPFSERVLFFKDTGPGIVPGLRDRIFEPFFTTKGPHKGTGIGLFVVSQALSDLGGTVRLESEPGEGATFIVTLPAGSGRFHNERGVPQESKG